MRPSRRKGAHSDPAGDSKSGRRPPRRRRDGRPHHSHRPDRRQRGQLLTSDVDPRDREFITGERTAEGFFRVRAGLDQAIARGLAYAPYADLIWCETSEPNLEEARRFAEAIHAKYPGKMLAYNCSPSFNWKKKLDDETIARFQEELGEMGYKFQFVTLAGFHALNHSMFELARHYKERGMAAYAELQQREFASEVHGSRRPATSGKWVPATSTKCPW